MSGISDNSRVSSGMKRTTNIGGVLFDGEKGDWTKGWYEETNATDVMGSFHVVHYTPTSGCNLMFVIPKGDHWRWGGSVVEKLSSEKNDLSPKRWCVEPESGQA